MLSIKNCIIYLIVLILIINFSSPYTIIVRHNTMVKVIEASSVPFYISWIIHIHQPLYNENGSLIELLESGKAPEWLPNVWISRAKIYRDLIPLTALNMTGDEALQVDITGTLIQQLNELEENNWYNCLYCGWKNKWLEAVNEKTSIGLPRLRILGAGYYHPIFPLINRADVNITFINQVLEHQRIIKENFGIDPGPGFFLIEEAFTPEIIPLITKLGYKWIVIDSEQLLRATYGYHSPYTPSPNPYDVKNPDPEDWDWGISPQLVFRPHVIEYNGYRIVAFIRYRHMSQAEMSGTSIDYLINQIKHFQQYNTDPRRPFIMVIVHDGENGWPLHNNGLDYYVNYLVEFLKRIHSDPELSFIKVIGLDEYLAKIYNPLNDTEYKYSTIWAEPGSWETMNTWGDPLFTMWNYPDVNSPDQKRWGLWVKALNYYLTAQTNNIDEEELEKALQWIMIGETSCYYYWDGNHWWDVKAIRAFNNAINTLTPYITTDNTPPTLRYAWRIPYNPENEFTIYIQAYDISGISRIKAYIYINNSLINIKLLDEIGVNNFYVLRINNTVKGSYKIIVEAIDTHGNSVNYTLIRPFYVSGRGTSQNQPATPFIMDGLPDTDKPFYTNDSGEYVKHLWAILTRDGILYVATEPANDNIDVFIFIYVDDTGYYPAPWLKNGSVYGYMFYLGNEGRNGWSGWFKRGDKLLDKGVGSACGEVLEGYINLTYYLGKPPSHVYVTVAVYETEDHGGLLQVLIRDNNDYKVDQNEYVDP